jgi:aryl-alcohol dehydrogenase-like predicted oxidoreductase
MARRNASDAERTALFRAAIDAGLTAIDTAPLYGFGEADRQLGACLRQLPRGQVQILSKVGLRWDDDHGDVLFAFHDAEGHRRQVRKDSRPVSVRRDVEATLARLGVETLDLVQIHHPDLQVPIAESMGELLRLRDEGKLRHIGVSNFSVAQIEAAQEALGDVPLCSVQQDYSLVRRRIEAEVLPACRRLAIGVLAYSPLAEGVLSGRAIDPRQPGLAPIQDAITQRLLPLARAHGTTPVAIALAWLIAQPGVTAAITGASSTAQLQEQIPALTIRLAEGELKLLTDAFARTPLPYGWEAPGRGLRGGLRRGRALAGRLARRIGLDPAALRRKPVHRRND